MSNQYESPNLDYMLLSRFKQDLDFYFGWGGRNAKHLYFDTIEEHLEETEKLFDSLAEKPEWFTRDDLNRFKELPSTEQPHTAAERDYHRYLNSNTLGAS